MSLRPYSFDSPMVPFSDVGGGQMWDPFTSMSGGQLWDPSSRSMRRNQQQILHNAHMDQYSPLLSADLIESPTDFHVI